MTDELAAQLAKLTPDERRRLLDRLRRQRAAKAGGPEPRPGDMRSLPLSATQERFWLLEQLTPGNPAYNVTFTIRISGPLDQSLLARALAALVMRHEALRTTLLMDHAGRPRQVVQAEATVDLPREDLSFLSEEARRRELERLDLAQSRQRFELLGGHLIVLRLVALSEREHLLLGVAHHIVFDGPSVGIFVDDLASLYGALRAGGSGELPPLPLQLADYCLWEHDGRPARTADQLPYWKEHLAGAPPLSTLPVDRPRPSVTAHRAGELEFELGAPLFAGVSRLCHGLGVTLYAALLAAFALTLQRAGGVGRRPDRVVVGVPADSRTHPGLERTVGCLFNAQALMVDLGGQPSFEALLRRGHAAVQRAYAHHDVPLAAVVEAVQPVRSERHNPLFQTFLSLIEPVPGPRHAGETAFEVVGAPSGATDLDLFLRLRRDGDRLRGSCLYDAELYDVDTVARALDVFVAALSEMAAGPARSISAGSAVETTRARAGGGSAERPGRWLPDLVSEQARRHAGAVAVEAVDGTLTYAQLEARANQLAHHLGSLGLGRGAIVAVQMERTLDLPVALLGVLKAGAAYLPLDPSHPAGRTAFIVEDARPAMLITRLEHEPLSKQPTSAPPLAGSPGDLAYVIYTSGSTGRPKGVMIPHLSLVNALLSFQERPCLEAGDVLLATTTVSFDIAALELFLPLVTGARVVLLHHASPFDPESVMRALEGCGVTVMQATPSTWRMLLRSGWQGGDLRVLCGGEALPSDLAAQLLERAPVVWNLYGPTETTIWSAAGEVEPGRRPPLGTPIANTDLHALDGGLAPSRIGVAGELFIGGQGVGWGYLGRPGLTAERFLPDPFSALPGSRMYRTGDLVREDADGRLDFLGRADEQIKIRGHRVELNEVESALREHPAVSQAAVRTVPGPDGDPALAAFLELVAEGGGDQGAEREQLGRWENVWSTTYDRATPAPAADLATAGWNSSYDGRPIPAGDMAEWADGTAAAIRRLRPRRVLEIGCGTGMVLLRLAAECEAYCGLDVSAVVLRQLDAAVSSRGLPAGRVRLLQRPAHDLGDLARERFDTVVLSSVVQYFPSGPYLARVLDGVADLLAPGGAIFIGDVRSRELLHAFHASVQLWSAPRDLTQEQLRRRIREAVARDEELLLSPGFFAGFARRAGLALEIRPKPGRADNELTRYRYDVLLSQTAETLQPRWTEWVQEPPLAGDPPIGLRHVPNPRLAHDSRLLRLLREHREGTAGDLRETLSEVQDPALVALSGAAERAGLTLELLWSDPAHPFCLDAVLRGPGASFTPWQGEAPEGDWARELASSPLRARRLRDLVPDLRRFLAERLLEAMVPSVFTVLERLPMSPNGKLDRRALPAPEIADMRAAYRGPGTDTERALVAIWKELLRRDRVGVDDDFFALGGHSLLAADVVSLIRQRLGHELPLRAMLECRTISSLAARLDRSAEVGPHLRAGEPST